jgi:HNH endonuclease
MELLRCFYCSKVDGPFHNDHIVPISRGGKDEPRNVVKACQACNLSKSDYLVAEWFDSGRAPWNSIPENIQEQAARAERLHSNIDSRVVARNKARKHRRELRCDGCGRAYDPSRRDDMHLAWRVNLDDEVQRLSVLCKVEEHGHTCIQKEDARCQRRKLEMHDVSIWSAGRGESLALFADIVTSYKLTPELTHELAERLQVIADWVSP